MDQRIDLAVPFAEKDQARSMGARWDPSEKTWYVPRGLDPGQFQRWRSTSEDEADTELVPPVFSVESRTACWKCESDTRVATVAAASFRYLSEPENRLQPNLYLFSTIRFLPRHLLEAIRQINEGYRRRFSKTAGATYYMNHCSCGAPLGDFFMHSEPGGAFFPMSPGAARAIRLRQLDVRGRLEIGGSPSVNHPNLILDYGERVAL
jgi:hypothetical protein